MKRLLLVAALGMLASAILFGAEETQDPVPAQIARVEGAQSPNRQGFNHTRFRNC